MADKPQNVQDVFLNTVRKKRVPVTIFLSNGVKLQGNITSFDNIKRILFIGMHGAIWLLLRPFVKQCSM